MAAHSGRVETRFVDEAQLHAKGGDGGAGAVSFRREAHVDRGGPDGGNGGRGGDVWLEASSKLSSLLTFRDHPHRRAGHGGHGSGGKRHGRDGEDLVVAVPQGTVVRTLEGEVQADLALPGERWLAAKGGRGGRGNASFLSNRRRAPSFAEQGEAGQERWYDLELKLMADVALVGFPNAGKSTLISTVSAAKPRIADYPFTTLEPHLGVVRLQPGSSKGQLASRDDVDMVIADIPGLIEGAAQGKGLGHSFLRHIERARVLAILLDLDPNAPVSPRRQQEVLLQELGAHRPELLDRPRLVVGTKADLIGTGPGPDEPAVQLSAVTGMGVDRFLWALADMVSAARQAATSPIQREPVVHRPEPEGISVSRRPDGVWMLSGREVERAVSLNDLTDGQALDYIQRRLRRLGVERALRRAGAVHGDLVKVGELELTYEPDR